MRVDDFDFHLPEERIALRPARPRDAARLLVVRAGGTLEDRIVRDLPELLRPGDLMVFNDTRTIPAALKAWRAPRRADAPPVACDVNLHKRETPDAWRAFARPGKRLGVGDQLDFADGLSASIEGKGDGGEVLLRFSASGPALDQAVARAGVMPLPPYIARKRAIDDADLEDYQTVYAAKDGSVATPTAGLHFTDRLLAALEEKGIERLFVTLHVGAGTFMPVKAEDVSQHVMHAEWCEVSPDAAARLNAARAADRRIVAVGTTALRTLESVADEQGRFAPFLGETAIFITPGHRFRAVDALITNFHLPKSTLMMLVSAFSGMETMRRAYAHAIASGYRFYSYGDASLLERA
jgi:S-adenosylmethionine:tRNA ribosyltransferase-isomerase